MASSTAGVKSIVRVLLVASFSLSENQTNLRWDFAMLRAA